MNALPAKGVEVESEPTEARFDCNHECHLFHNGILYPCCLKNISISGALVYADNFPPSAMKIGDMCHLSLNIDPLSDAAGGYTSKVTRFEKSHIGLHFLTISF